MDQQLIDRIYECAFGPECWPGVLDELARIADARGGFLLTATTDIQNWTASDSMRRPIEEDQRRLAQTRAATPSSVMRATQWFPHGI